MIASQQSVSGEFNPDLGYNRLDRTQTPLVSASKEVLSEMINSRSTSHDTSTEAKLPRRDWILLPLISLLTMMLMVVSTESLSRRMFSVSKTSIANGCVVRNDPAIGIQGVPNTVCWEKSPEGQLAEFRFNGCGHRAGMECGPKSPGTYRIVLTGGSVPLGASVPMEQTFAGLLPAEISKRTGRNVEIYNESMFMQSPGLVALHFNAVLAAQPDLVLWTVIPFDIQGSALSPGFQPMPGFLGKTRGRVKAALAADSIQTATQDILYTVHDLLDTTSSGLLLEHFLYESQSLYVKAYLKNVDNDSGFLKSHQSARWQTCLQYFAKYAADIEARAKAAGVPLVVVLVPNRAQAAMISMGEWPAGRDPYKLSDELRSIVVSDGATYADILPDYRGIPNPEQGFFPKDGHPNAEGHSTIARLIANELTSGAVPALRVTPGSQDMLKKGE
jgi:hypothetical protein